MYDLLTFNSSLRRGQTEISNIFLSKQTFVIEGFFVGCFLVRVSMSFSSVLGFFYGVGGVVREVVVASFTGASVYDILSH